MEKADKFAALPSVWHSDAQAIHTTFPGAAVAGPGVFEDINYATNLINGEGKVIDIVTHRYYRGQVGTSVATLANLMNLDSAVTSARSGPRRIRAADHRSLIDGNHA